MLRVAAIRAFFDASGAAHQGTELVVSGFVSTVEKWKQFEGAWHKLLKNAGISYFRMLEFTSCTGEFAQWKMANGKPDEDRRRPFLQRLIDVVVKYSEQSIATGVLLKDWRRCNRYYRLAEENFQPYSLCGWTCIENVYQWCDENGHRRDQLLFFFEDGDHDKGHLETRVKQDFGIRLNFGGKVPKPNEPAMLPLQAADFAAWHVRRVLDEAALGTRPRRRYDFEELFSRVPYESYHRHYSMTPGIRTAPTPGKRFSPLKISSGIPSLIRFSVEHRVPAR